MRPPIITISFFKYKGFRQKAWAFGMMQFAHNFLKTAKGLQFYRVMGTGRGRGFRWKADFSTYSLLSVWDSEALADNFINTSKLYSLYTMHCQESFTVFMKPVKSHGRWSGINPFKPDAEMGGDITAVITRATISTRHLLRFWKNVPGASHSLDQYSELIMAKGIGEWPIRQMATFSLWEKEASMLAYAYQNKDHLDVIKKTRQYNWYNEELFARFRPFKSRGTWEGRRLLPF
jgi:hypothetical protein